MKVKVGLFDKALLKQILSILSVISMLLSFVLIVVDISEKNKKYIGIIIIVSFIILYIITWINANLSKRVKLTINNSVLEIKIGDIFEEDELKVIAFNEYFDTQVNDRLISDKTLNGMYIKRYVQDISLFDNLIKSDQYLSKNIIKINKDRRYGKKDNYKLGSIFKHNKYLLTAFSKFDNENRAYLNMEDYIDFLLNFWNEIDCVYNGHSVSIPLLGSGITRFKGYNLSDQELLELLIWSFKVSKIKFSYPSRVSIIIHKSKKDKINFYKLRSVNNGL